MTRTTAAVPPPTAHAAGGRPGPLTLGSVCTGYGGLDMAIATVLDVTPAWVADPDPGAAAILAHHMPGVPNLGDITRLDWTTVPPVDVLCGGYPCQPFSVAGKRRGTADDRHLWPYIARAIRVLRPKLAVFENVANHLRIGFDQVLRDLAALRFDAEWCLVRASEIGAAHRRERLIFIARPADAPSPRLQGARLRGRAPDRSGAAADADHVRGDRSATEHRAYGWPVAARDAAADPAGLGEREPADAPDAVAGGGPARPEPGGRGVQPPADTARDGRREGRPESARVARRPDTPLGGGADVDWGTYAPAIDRWARVLGRPAPTPRLPTGRDGADQLSPVFVEWLMGLPDGHVTGVPGLTRNQMLKALGNGVVPQQGAAALDGLLDRMEVA